MATQKKLTSEEFDAKWRGLGRERTAVSIFDSLIDELQELAPVPVTVGHDDLLTRRSALRSAVVTRFGSGKRVRTIISDGVLYACLMPESENSK